MDPRRAPALVRRACRARAVRRVRAARRVPALRRVACLTLVAVLALAACTGGGRPRSTPMDLSGVVTELIKRQVAVVQTIGGDPGCDDASLRPNGVHLRVSLTRDPTVYDVYLFRFKDDVTWGSQSAAVTACAAAVTSTASAPAGGSLQTIAVSPYRAFGLGWPSALRVALDGALRVS
ncbi:MAG: hypothetical protein ACRDGL_11885 [Candidatus Limnocylindrales bacterium]